MYETYWGLTGKPFLNTANPRLAFFSHSHEEALVRMLYTVTESKGLMLLLGEEGIGKTFSSYVFATELREKGYPVAFLKSPGRTPDDLLIQTLYEFGISHYDASRVEKLQVLSEVAVTVSRNGQHLIVIIDDAQLITDPTAFDEVRSFLNISGEEHFLITVILCGTPDLWGRLIGVPGMRQRVGVSYRILPLSPEETEEYINHRLACVGRTDALFDSDAFALIHTTTRGVPREINNLSDLCLLIGSGEEANLISTHLVEKAIEELAGQRILGEG
ncbi:MAG: ExeA family protein [Planctomycetota bacterium]|jgi:type II secretory pathway predicted ATPase ExeA